MVVANIHEQWVDPNAIKVGGVWLQWSGTSGTVGTGWNWGICRAGQGLGWHVTVATQDPMANHHFPMMNQLPARCTWSPQPFLAGKLWKDHDPQEDPCWRMLPWGLKPQWCYDCYAWYDELLRAIRGTSHLNLSTDPRGTKALGITLKILCEGKQSWDPIKGRHPSREHLAVEDTTTFGTHLKQHDQLLCWEAIVMIVMCPQANSVYPARVLTSIVATKHSWRWTTAPRWIRFFSLARPVPAVVGRAVEMSRARNSIDTSSTSSKVGLEAVLAQIIKHERWVISSISYISSISCI